MRGIASLASARASVCVLILGMTWLSVPTVAFSSTKNSASAAKTPFAYNTDGIVNIGADPASVSGPAVLQFQGITHASFNPAVVQPFNLGQFVALPSSLASGQTTTYNNTPFEVEVQAPEFNKSSRVPILDQVFPSLDRKLNLKSSVENSLLLKGHLDGTVSANGQVSVVATVDSIKLGSIAGGGSGQSVRFTFPIRYSQFVLPSNWVMSTSSPSVTVPSSTPNSMVTALSASPTGTVAPVPAAEMVTVSTSNSTSTPTVSTLMAAAATAPLPTPAPEPSTVFVFVAGIVGLALGRRRLQAR